MKYDHAYSFGFSLISEKERGEDVTGSDFRKSIQKRIDSLSDEELEENCGIPWDTFKED